MMGVLHLDCGGGYTKLHVATPYSTIPTHTQLQAVKLVRSEYTLCGDQCPFLGCDIVQHSLPLGELGEDE